MKKLIQVLIVCGLFVFMGGTANGGFFDELEKSLKEASKEGEQKREKEFKQLIEKLKTESASDIKPTGKLYDLYKMGSDNTDLQRKRMEKKIIGKVVIWELKVYEVDLYTENIYKIQTSGDSSVSSFAYISPESDEERDYIEELKTGSYITVKGKIEDISFRSISIKPAILWGEKWNKNKKVSSAPSTNDCPSETDSLKRLTCYDNLPDNLKNKDCSSISDSLKRLSCFETEKNSDVAEETNRDSIQSKQSSQDKEMDAEYEKSEEAKKNNNWVLAKEIVTPLAEKGHAKSQGRLGGIYFFGFGEVPKDLKKAFKWLKLGADQGDDRAQLFLGIMYSGGIGVPQDYKEAFKWRKLSAEQGNAFAQIDLALMYEFAQGVPQDYKEAVKWYRLSAEQGNAKAQWMMGNNYYNGNGVPQDYKEAFKWYRLSAEQGNAKAQSSMGNYFYSGNGVPQNYKEAVRWWKLAAEQGHADSQSNLGVMYSQGQGVAQNFKESMKWYLAAAKQGHAGAQNGLGWIYQNGQGVPQDYKEAVKWYRLSAKQGNANAQKNLIFVENIENQRRLKEGCGDKLCPEHIAIMQSFVNNLETENIDKVVSNINYPIEFYTSGKKIAAIEDSYQFKKYYEYIFPKNKIKEITTKFSHDDFSNFIRNGKIMFGGGAIWFDLNGQATSINHIDDILITKMANKIKKSIMEDEKRMESSFKHIYDLIKNDKNNGDIETRNKLRSELERLETEFQILGEEFSTGAKNAYTRQIKQIKDHLGQD